MQLGLNLSLFGTSTGTAFEYDDDLLFQVIVNTNEIRLVLINKRTVLFAVSLSYKRS